MLVMGRKEESVLRGEYAKGARAYVRILVFCCKSPDQYGLALIAEVETKLNEKHKERLTVVLPCLRALNELRACDARDGSHCFVPFVLVN